MARNTPGAPDFDPSGLDQTLIGDVMFLGWKSEHAAPLTAGFAAALAQLGLPQPATSDAGAAAPSGPVPAGVTATSGADTFLPYTATPAAAVAAAPAVAQLSENGAAQGNTIDFAALLALLSASDGVQVLHDPWLV